MFVNEPHELLEVDRSVLDQLKYDDRGLLPAIAQDSRTGQVLMLAYVNRQSLEHTLATGLATYWSRSRRELWTKGLTSGHVQRVRRILFDCDLDAVLYLVEQVGPACHTGRQSCFFHVLKPTE
ncbi:MAG: phosphoribosyl-AMP cyclohydrolase [candidate division KSB1 bacterium]|nr:phosphoribosyl-AMP cyclohydrolase [candidate division KSB1 bacterium]